MIGFIVLGTNDLERAKLFYDELFAVIGATRVLEGRRGCNWGFNKDCMFGVMTPFDGKSATAGNGVMISLRVKSRSLVHDLHAKALALGGADEGAPGVRRRDAEHVEYFAYFRDLDGNKIAAFCRSPSSDEQDK